MDPKALSEAYDIINLMDKQLIKQIPEDVINGIRDNRDALYSTGIKELPNNSDNLRQETKIILATIYEDYFLNMDKQIEDDDSESFYKENEYKEFVNKQKTIVNTVEKQIIKTYGKTNIYEKIKKLFKKIITFFKKY